MAQINAITWVILLLGHFHFFTITKAHHEILLAQIKNGDEIIELNWKRTQQYLVNSNLPIWLAKKDTRPVWTPSIMQDIGEIVTYQDVEKSSAVVYVPKEKLLYGIIDTRFYITRLPFDEELGPYLFIEVGKGHVFSYDDNGNKYNNDNENENNAENLHEMENNIENEEYHDDITAKFTENEKSLIYSILDSIDGKKNLEHSHENHDDITAKFTENDLSVIYSILDSIDGKKNREHSHENCDEFSSETYAADRIHDSENSITNFDDKNEHGNDQDDYQKYYDDILAELTNDETNAMKSALDSPSETREESKNDDEMEIGIENQRYYENKNDNGDGEEFNNENMEDYDDILSELTKDEINIVNSLIDSTNTPSISKQSSQHIIQQNVDHAKASTSALEVPEIDPTYQHQSNKQNKITGSHQSKLKIFYPEILVFVDNNIIAKFITGNSLKNIRQLILYYIVYFNAIDMLFAKLATDTVVMHINIAGLVLESEPGTFPSGNSKSHQDFGNTPQQWHADKILFKYINYINTYKKSFPDDSFDFFFLSTNSGIRKSGKILSAHSRSSTNIYAQRRRNAIYTDLLGSVVHFRENYRGYIDATRAIAQILGIEYDPLSEESKINGEQCYSIMQKSQTDCQNCLKWSMRNQNEFNAYFRSNTNRCFLMNYPRSLRPFDQPAITVSSRAQCTCYGDGNFEVDRNGQEVDPFRRCHKKLICSAKRKKMSPLPLDGTPCDENKVCWGKKCVGVVTKMIPDRVPAPAIKRLLQIDPSRTDKIAKKSRLSRTASTIMGKN